MLYSSESLAPTQYSIITKHIKQVNDSFIKRPASNALFLQIALCNFPEAVNTNGYRYTILWIVKVGTQLLKGFFKKH